MPKFSPPAARFPIENHHLGIRNTKNFASGGLFPHWKSRFRDLKYQNFPPAAGFTTFIIYYNVK